MQSFKEAVQHMNRKEEILSRQQVHGNISVCVCVWQVSKGSLHLRGIKLSGPCLETQACADRGN